MVPFLGCNPRTSHFGGSFVETPGGLLLRHQISRPRLGLKNVAIITLEQLAPFPFDRVKEAARLGEGVRQKKVLDTKQNPVPKRGTTQCAACARKWGTGTKNGPFPLDFHDFPLNQRVKVAHK